MPFSFGVDMSDLEVIAKKKVDAASERHISSLPEEIQTIQRELSAKGLLRSGVMLKRVLSACCTSLEAQAETVRVEYEWVVSQALWTNKPWIEHLIVVASNSLDSFHEPVKTQLKKACNLAGQPKLLNQLYVEFQSREAAEKSAIALALRTKFAERRRGFIRTLPSRIQRLMRVFTGGSL